MVLRRAPLALLFCAVLLVTASFAANKKSERHRNESGAWRDWSLQGGDLPSTGSGVSDGVGNLTLSQGGGPGGVLILPPGIPDNWNGGTGNWSVPGNWSAGEPGSNSDVTIYSGATDLVTLDVGSTTISSLTLGGPINGFSSRLKDGGTPQTLTITNGLTINATGSLVLTGGSTVSAASLTDNDLADIEHGSTLQINGNASNSGDLFTDNSGFGGNNTINITGNLDNNGLVQLFGSGDKVTIGGTLTNELGAEVLLFGAGSMATTGGLSNAGTVDVENGSTLQVNGGAGNSGNLYTDQLGLGGKNTVNITGTLTNSGNFVLYGPGDMATLGGLITSQLVDVEHGSTLQINGDANNSADLFTDLSGFGGNNKLNITGNLTNTGIVELFGAGDMATIGGTVTNQLDAEVLVYGAGSKATMGSLNNAGIVDVENGSTLQINGDASNSGNLYTDQLGMGGKNTLNITGMLTNQAGGMFVLYGPGDMATVGNGVSNSGMIDVEDASSLKITGDVTNSGSILTDFHNFGGGNTLNISGMLTNDGVLALSGHLDVATIGSLTNDAGAFVNVENGSTLNVTGDATNAGLLETNGFNYGGGNTIAITGMLTNAVGGQINLNGPGDVLQALAGLSNRGVINVNNGSSIDPPFFNNLGTVNIDGTSRLVVGTPTPMGGQGYIQLHNGTLGEMISATNFGVINVNGSALLDGTLAILLQGSYNPTVGSTFKFLNFTPGMLSGVFANIENDIFNGGTEKWFVDYENGGGYVELIAEPNGTPVPEPATLLVFIPGLLGMGYGLRRRLLG